MANAGSHKALALEDSILRIDIFPPIIDQDTDTSPLPPNSAYHLFIDSWNHSVVFILDRSTWRDMRVLTIGEASSPARINNPQLLLNWCRKQ